MAKIWLHGPLIKFRARGAKSELGPLLWNKYVFFYDDVGHPTHFFFLTYPLKNTYHIWAAGPSGVGPGPGAHKYTCTAPCYGRNYLQCCTTPQRLPNFSYLLFVNYTKVDSI